MTRSKLFLSNFETVLTNVKTNFPGLGYFLSRSKHFEPFKNTSQLKPKCRIIKVHYKAAFWFPWLHIPNSALFCIMYGFHCVTTMERPRNWCDLSSRFKMQSRQRWQSALAIVWKNDGIVRITNLCEWNNIICVNLLLWYSLNGMTLVVCDLFWSHVLHIIPHYSFPKPLDDLSTDGRLIYGYLIPPAVTHHH